MYRLIFKPVYLLIFGLAGVALHLFAQIAGPAGLELLSKVVPVACLLAWLHGRPGRYTGLIRLGLAFSLLGDILLEVSDAYFIWGLLAFLLAHLAYVLAFCGQSRRPALLRLLPILLWLAVAYTLLLPHLGALAIPVAVYVCVIGAMLWRALALASLPLAGWQLAACLGALLFGISDTVLAFNRFHTAWPGANLVVILTYWVGQYGLARSAWLHRAQNG